MEVLVYDIETDGSIGNQSVMATVTIEMNSIDFPCDLPSGQSLHWHLNHHSVCQCMYWVCVCTGSVCALVCVCTGSVYVLGLCLS